MPGIGLVMNIAKEAVAAQQVGLNVVGNNIANVNTPSYSKQYVPHTSKNPLPYRGLLVGTGVDVEQIQQSSDQMLENRLVQQKSYLASYEEASAFLGVMETLFNENSDSSIGGLISEFWNSWHDLSNNPTGTSERDAVYENGVRIAERLDTMNTDLATLKSDLNREIESTLLRVNSIADEIAKINNEIIGLELRRTANDQRDKRNALLSEMAELVDVYTFEQDNGSMTVTTASGYTIVNGPDTFNLAMTGDEIYWEGSNNQNVDVTDRFTSGKIGGWLDMRDETLAKFEADLETLAKEFIWTVNYQHSQGVGVKLFDSAITGTYQADATGLFDTLAHASKIDYTEDFKVWVHNDGTSPATANAYQIDMDIATATPTYGGNFAVADGQYAIEILQGGTVGTDDIQFRWEEAGGASGTVTMSSAVATVSLNSGTLTFTAGDVLASGNAVTINTAAATGAPAPLVMSVSGAANSILDMYQFKVISTTNGTVGTDTIDIEWSSAQGSGSFTLDASTTSVDVDGMTLDFTSGILAAGDVFTIATDSTGATTTNLRSEWHWTQDSFVRRFNDQVVGVTASRNANNTLTLTPTTDGPGLSNINFSDLNGFTAANTTITVNTLAGMTADNNQFRLDWDGAAWAISNNGAYGGAQVLAGGDAGGFELDLDGDNSADITVAFAANVTAIAPNSYLEFDVNASGINYDFGFGDDQFTDSGVAAALGFNTFFAGHDTMTIEMNTVLAEKDNIAVAQIDGTTGTFGVGDNANALAIADLQTVSRTFAQWTYTRGQEATSSAMTTTLEGYHQVLIGGIGIQTLNVSRSRDFAEVMVNKLGEQRDTISGVSLDEEMVNMMKYQHAYTVASKLLKVADEMLTTLIATR